MFDWVAGIGGGLFVLASIAVGGRLCVRGIRRGSLPELTLGGGLLLSGGIGYPLQSIAQLADGLPDALRAALLVAHMLCNVVGLGGLGLFTWRVFRPHSGAARFGAVAVPVSLFVVMSLQIQQPGLMTFVESMQGPWLLNSHIGVVVLVWSGTESLLHHRLLVRRLRLGLANPVVVNRMFLWGFAMFCAASISLATLTLEALGFAVMGTAAGAAIVGPLGLVTAGAVSLAFWPPSFYLRWISSRTAVI